MVCSICRSVCVIGFEMVLLFCDIVVIVDVPMWLSLVLTHVNANADEGIGVVVSR